MMIQEPAATFGVKAVIADAAAAGAGMNDLTVARIDRDMIDARAVGGEEKEIAGLQHR